MKTTLLVAKSPRGALMLLFAFISLSLTAQLSVNVTGNDICFGLTSGGIATAEATGGTQPYSYAWSNGATSASIGNLSAGTYRVTVTDANDNQAQGSVTLTQSSEIVVEINCELSCGAPYVLVADAVGGAPPYNYKWSTGETTRTISTLEEGKYCVTVYDSNLCGGNVPCKEVEANPVYVTVTAVDVLCPGNDDGSLTANPLGGVAPYTYRWSNGATSRTINGLAPGTYQVTITDAQDCTDTASGTVEEPPALDLTIRVNGENCEDQANVYLAARATGGTPPYTYLWNTGATSDGIGPLPEGTYTLTVTDANNCVIEESVTLVDRPAVEIEIIGDLLLCGEASTGSLSARPLSGPVNQYSYRWSTGATTSTINGVGAGTYSVTATDSEGCQDVASATVEVVDLDVNLSSTPITCFGDSDGTATVTATGGDQPYTYLWSTGATTRQITGLSAGTYRVTVTEANNCKAEGSVIISAPPALSLSATVTNSDCEGNASGSINLSVSGGTPAYTYRWSNGATSQDLENLSAGTYTVTVTDANNCTATLTRTITAPSSIVITGMANDVDCFGDATGSISITASGGTPAYTYLWSTGATSRNVNGLAAGTYSVTVTDSRGCTANREFVIAQPSDFTVGIDADDADCFGAATGNVDLTVSGATAPYTYAWSNGASTQDLTGVVAGTYSVTITDANDCTTTTSTTVGQPARVVITLTPTPADCFGDASGSIAVSVTGGTPGYTYSWSTGATTGNISGLAAGSYTLTVTDANGCTATARATVSQPTQVRITGTVSPIDCTDGADGAINITASGGTSPYSYLWSTGAVTEDLQDLSTGTYAVTVTDANGCTASTSFTVTAPSDITITGTPTDVDCFGDATGSITITASGGTPSYSYSWSTGATSRNLSGLTAGTYTVTVTDSNGCTAAMSFTVNQPTDFTVTVDDEDVDCFGDATGSATLTVSGATPPYSYEWSNGATTRDLTGLTAGTYTVTITDANDCEAVATASVGQPSRLVVNATPSPADCFGDATGSVSLSVSGGTPAYSYRWSNGATTANLDNVAAGTYMVTVTDANGCQDTESVTVSQPARLQVTGTTTPVACEGDATGSIDISVSGGTAPYAYSWSNGASVADINNLPQGSYMVTVTDANGCTAVQTFNVGSSSAISVTGTPTPADCFGEATGSVDIQVSGGTGTYSYSWSNGATTQDLDNVPAGIYTVTVSDGNDCDATATFTVGQPDDITITTTAPNIVCGGTATGTITVQATGGSAPYTYQFSNGFTGGNIVTNLPAGNYSVTVTDANGCTAVDNNISLGELPVLTCAVEIISDSEAGDDGSVRVTATGGTAPFTYAWSNGETTRTIDGLAPGTYSVTVTDANGCTTTCSATLRPLSGLGDFVWLDQNANGQQDVGEPGIEDFPVFLKDASGTIIDETRTDANGRYAFLGLEPGTYSVFFDAPEGAITTLLNTGDDTTDSDADPDMNNMTGNYTLAPGEYNMTVDAGFFTEPGAAITDPCNCLNNNTNDIDGQFSEEIAVYADPGQTWTIVARQNMFLLDGTNPPIAPTPVPLGTELVETSPGVYTYQFKLVDEFVYSSVLTNGVFELTISNTCTYPTLDFLTLPPETLCRFEEPFQLEGQASIPGDIVFTVNGVEVDALDPMSLPLGEVVIEGQLIPTDPEECIVTIRRQVILIDDCDAKIGDFVWLDENANGIQDAGEPGIEGVKATVTSQDGSYTDMTTTDETGMYMFLVPPGTYKVTFEVDDDNLSPSPPNRGTNDAVDSDVNPSTLMTGFYTVGPYEMDLTIDAGFFLPCIDNVTNPGTIGYDQEVCGPGNTPNRLVELTPASGGTGEIEYLWMKNTVNPNLDIVYWSPIPGSNTPDYQPGPVSQTTYFTRCIRRDDCPFIESNIVTIEVGTDAVANVNGPDVLCVGETGTFTAQGAASNAVISWSFTGNASTTTSSARTVNVSWATFGQFSATLTVTSNGCVSTQVYRISVVRTPSRCGSGLQLSGQVDNLQQRAVTLEWEVPADGNDYEFEVQRSTNGSSFQNIAMVSEPSFASGGMGYYQTEDVSPMAGRTFYRIMMRDADFGDLMSNVVELNLAPATAALGRIFPNPVVDDMLHIEMTEMPDNDNSTSVIIFDAMGKVVKSPIFADGDSGVLNLSTEGLPAGVYLVRLNVGGKIETHRVVIE